MSGLRRLSAACATVLVASGLVVAPFLAGPASAAELIQDGGFEAATGNSAQQPQLDRSRLHRRVAAVHVVELLDHELDISAAHRHRLGPVRRPGRRPATPASLSQTVVIPAGTATLTYWYRNGLVTSPFTATLRVQGRRHDP